MIWESKNWFRFCQSDQKVTKDCYGIYMNFTELFIASISFWDYLQLTEFIFFLKSVGALSINLNEVQLFSRAKHKSPQQFLEFLIIHIDCSTTPCTIDPEKKYMVLQYSIKKHVMSRNMKHYYVFMLRLMTCEYHNGMIFFLNLQFQMYSHVFTNYFFNFHFKFLLLHIYIKHFDTLT